jgi:hypothetical protein
MKKLLLVALLLLVGCAERPAKRMTLVPSCAQNPVPVNARKCKQVANTDTYECSVRIRFACVKSEEK